MLAEPFQVEWEHLRSELQHPTPQTLNPREPKHPTPTATNILEVDTLLIIPGLMSGVSPLYPQNHGFRV